MSRQIVIRSNGSAQIGSGHIRRMAILAGALHRREYSVVLLCNPNGLSVFPPAARAFDRIIEVDDEPAALATLAAMDENIDAIFFDDYALRAEDHRLYRAFAPFLAGIDDLASRQLDWDMLFDLNPGRDMQDYEGLIPEHTVCHFGPAFQIIKPDFFDRQAESLARKRWPLQRVFISLGGTDPFNLTGRVLLVAADCLPDCHFDVVSGSMSPHFSELKNVVSDLGQRAILHADAQNVPELMANADLAIGAGGTMTWERNALGLPSVMLVIADNQEQVGDAMRGAKAAIVVDLRETSWETPLKTALLKLKNAPERLALLSRNAHGQGGENGAENIAMHLDEALVRYE